MKTHRQPSSRAFTLIELLVVITVIAILVSLAGAQIIKVIDDGNRVKVLKEVMELKSGIDAYQLDYNRFPMDSNAGNADEAPEVLTDGSNALVDALMGIPPATNGGTDLNPKRTPFSNFPMAKNDRHGLVGTTRPYKLNDMWGQPYHILLDTNGDNQVKNPDAINADPKIAQNKAAFLVVKSAVFSCGKDKTPHTADDIVSWRQK
jgi:prepilin-type N-terminal cleavage/methylation domain-containing protein